MKWVQCDGTKGKHGNGRTRKGWGSGHGQHGPVKDKPYALDEDHFVILVHTVLVDPVRVEPNHKID